MFLILCISTYGQKEQQKRIYDDFRLSFGINAINNLGTLSPLNSPDDWAFKTPFSVGIEYKLSHLFAIEELFSFNRYSPKSTIDGVVLNRAANYYSADSNIKYYIGEYFLNSEKIDLFLNGGVGLYKLDDYHGSANFGGGIFYWFSNQFGVSVQSIAKFTTGNNNDDVFDSNHYQHSLQLVYRF